MKSTKTWLASGAAGIIALLVAGWFLLVSPSLVQAAATRDETASQETANLTARAHLDQLAALKVALPEKEKELEALQVRIPSSVQLPDMIRNITALAKGAGVEVSAISPGTPVPMSGTQPAAAGANVLQEVPVALTVGGSYMELETFLSRIEKEQRATLVNSVSMETVSGTRVAGMSAQLALRIFLDAPASSSSLPAAAGGLAATGSSAAAAPDVTTSSTAPASS